VTAADAADAERQARAMCERVLANPVMEDFDVTVETA
jgi:phosphoribosylformylglycinamidine (FGAM) synthase PurS component